MVSVLQAAVVQERLSLAAGWWPIHLAAVLLIVLLFSWRLFINSPHHPAALWGACKRAVMFRKAARA
ncbi:MAG: LPS export ABC transporter permease LptF, partial [Bacillota bacterium]